MDVASVGVNPEPVPGWQFVLVHELQQGFLTGPVLEHWIDNHQRQPPASILASLCPLQVPIGPCVVSVPRHAFACLLHTASFTSGLTGTNLCEARRPHVWDLVDLLLRTWQ